MMQQQTITNLRSGQRMIFRQTAKDTNGQLLEIETFNPPSTEKEPEHVHPKQESSAEVLSGTVHFSINGRIQIVKAGEKVVIPSGVPHYFWNEGPLEARTIQRFTPALTIEQFFKSYFALANEGKLDNNGMPPLLITSHLGLQHQDDIRVTKPPWIVQKFLYTLLVPVRLILRRTKR
ncbi:quercetin dioxygenase-like cupin family protein [Planomicrobium sp. HSC-17F08]|nr:quercetin dioxygenase-like cupin family protein [Planomicrobium sp. HSC-17F08]